VITVADVRVTQTLASGITVTQDVRTATRFVFFDTGLPEWQYASHGGTLFVVLYKGKPYGLTCRHVLKDFNWAQLVVTDQRFGRRVAVRFGTAKQTHGSCISAQLLKAF
jgi:hypothetical protein